MKHGAWKGKVGIAFLAFYFISAVHTANAALVSRLGGQAVYDTAQNITWLTNADLAMSNAFGVGGGAISLDGSMTWATAQSWIAGMNAANYLGYHDWRLPTTPQPEPACSIQSAGGGYGYNCTSEMGNLFKELGGVVGNTLAQVHNADYNLFSNIQSYPYWSTEYAYYPSYAWRFNISTGYQDSYNKVSFAFVEAVRTGDVAAVPIPAAAWLFGSGLLGLIGIARRKTRMS